MNILALDQASRTSGWAVFSDKNLIDSGTFTITDKDLSIRLYKIKLKVIDLINKYDINEIIIEDIQLQKQINNVQTFKALAEVFGVLFETFEELDIPHDAVLATTWRSKLGIKGSNRPAQKKAAQEYVKEKYGIQASEDESDAICIGAYKTNKQADHNWA